MSVNIKRNVFIWLPFLILLHLNVEAQITKLNKDFGGWYTIGLNKKLSKKMVITFEQQIRMYAQHQKIDGYISDIGLTHKLNKHFELAGNLRYIYDLREAKTNRQNLRYNVDLQYKQKIASAIKLSYRFRYQRKEKDFLVPLYDRSTSNVRNRIKLTYAPKKRHQYYITAELFREIEQFKDPFFNRWRFSLGDKIKTKLGHFNIRLAYQWEIADEETFLFLAVGYFFKFK